MDFLGELRRQLEAFRVLLSGDLSAPVEHCPGWNVLGLAGHLGNENLWVATAVRDLHGDHQHVPVSADSLDTWFAGTCETMLAELSASPDTPAWTFAPPRTVGFWRRRRCHETMVHRWDAENALGRPTPIDPGLAADGVDEVLGTMAPRQVALDRTSAPRRAVRFHATDVGATWTYGPGEPVAEIAAPAESLYLLLWNRGRLDDPPISCTGDHDTARSTLVGPLVP
ncbi:maleylpyruvate isomerase family mycothiol-dependent enzyme [Saccharopolyspora rhizosphaerae]|uniref:Maleylpyruvate isomerase family mycothiol-dependent enzyme n=1 Tax=Saccharopolyspora rhizosphaerae TaxID=2492662 RepID=A0A426JJA0_9PSEU|nr:maleylpyruvate isomerase family mycothiol-dependent enzyme [Saccharopolyspora rhizosphaerae]RRO13110.1 maleylpyruvate isomerase family mycothiol-dependent enzyme [Saccharopolyspora rhizosphaerae]